MKEVLKVLYIGNHEDTINAFLSDPEKFELTKFQNCVRAMDYLKSRTTFNAIICEAKLPGMNGIEVGKMVKGLPEYMKTPFLIFSDTNDDKLFKAALKQRNVVSDLFVMPVDFNALYDRIIYLNHYFSELSENKEVKDAYSEYKIPLIKRAFDIVVSLIALLFLSPLFIIVALAIRIESKGQVIYKSKRVGTGYKIFDFLKFRSMYTGADAKLKDLKHLNQYDDQSKEKKEEAEILDLNCPTCNMLPDGEFCSPILFFEGQQICEHWYKKQKKVQSASTFIKISNDPRITKVGNFIRNTSIDELPQLVNVLKGDMSIVGNRPLPLYEAELLTSDDWSARFMGPAGITGLWQVELRGKGGKMSEDERKGLDNQYAETYSFWGDIKLIFRTIPALFQKENV